MILRQKKDIANSIFLLLVVAFLGGCGKRGKAVTFANICQEKNHSIVEIKGFLHWPKRADSNQILLVENADETGSFIQIAHLNSALISSTDGVKITGEVLKEGNSCVLKIEKIEAP
jgi:hypothetical protein